MLNHHLRHALRHLWRRKVYTFIILLSLTIGFAFTSLLVSFLLAETNTDSFHANVQRTFQLFSNDPFGEGGNIAYIPNYTPDYLQQHYPEVEQITQVGTLGDVALATSAGEFHDIDLLSVDSSFFSVFSYPLYRGSSDHALTSESIVLSKETALVLFGDTDVIGKLLTLKTADTTRSLAVAAVLDRAPENSHLTFEALVSHAVLKGKFNGGATYLMLHAEHQQQSLQQKINEDKQRPGLLGPGKINYFLEPLKNSYFSAWNKMTFMKTRSHVFIKIGAVVCGIIFFMASFNFVSLFLLSLQERKKESGIKKTLGISFFNLLKATSIEVMLYIVIAVALSFIFISFILPSFNSIVESSLVFNYMWRREVMLAIGAIVFVLGMLVVLFSVMQQGKVQPVALMKNANTSKITFNRSLFTVQFVISITLIICSITIIRQMDFIENEPLGFNRNILRLQSPDKSLNAKLPVLKQQLLQVNGVQHAAIASGNPLSGNWMARYDLENGEFYTPYLFSGDEDLIKTLDLTLLSGEFPSATNQGKLVNEKLVRYFRMAQPIGEKIPGTSDVIIGVVKDFTCTSFKEEIAPAIISYSQDNSRLLIDYHGQSLSLLLPQIEKEWSKVFPEHYFSYQIIQEELMKKYKSARFFYKTVVAFSVISILISCFGLFALSWAVAQSRVKEMGIRKVLGATAKDIMSLLTINFIKRIGIAFLIAAPAGYYLMDQWLHTFANRITLNAGIFIIAGIAVTSIALLTMSVQTVRAAFTNPVNELKNE